MPKNSNQSQDQSPNLATLEIQNSNQIFLTGYIGWDEDDDTLKNALAQVDGDVELYINSDGGSVTSGIAMYNTIKAHPHRVTGYIHGAAFSMASYIFQACDERVVYPNSLFMIHNARVDWASGDAKRLRKIADILDVHTQAIMKGYVRSGKSIEELTAMMDEETFMSGQEIVDMGFADSLIDDELDLAACFSGFELDARVVSKLEDIYKMPVENKGTGDKPTTAPSATNPNEIKAAIDAAMKAENDRKVAINAAFTGHEGFDQLRTDCLVDSTVTVEAAQGRLLKAIQDKYNTEPSGGSPAAVSVDIGAVAKREGMANVIAKRAGHKVDHEKLQGNPYMGCSLYEMAKAVLDIRGVSYAGRDRMDIVGLAFTQTSGDFPLLLQDSAYKTLMASYNAIQTTWRSWCKRGQVSNFLAHKRLRTGTFARLVEVVEGGEYKFASFGEKQESITAITKGRLINFTRQAIINDDLGAFNDRARMLGQAAARSVEIDTLALLESNPALSDTVALFHADHGNLGTAGAPSITTLDEAWGKFRALNTQIADTDGTKDYIDVNPDILLVPSALALSARQIMASTADPSAGHSGVANVHKGAYTVIDTPRLTSATAWYMMSSEEPVIEVAFLDGNETPFIETSQGFEVDGFATKVRLDYGVAAIGHTAVKNPYAG